MSKEVTESERLLLAEIQQLEKKLNRQHRGDLREFTKAAMQGLCGSSNPASLGWGTNEFAKWSVNIARATLAELERQA